MYTVFRALRGLLVAHPFGRAGRQKAWLEACEVTRLAERELARATEALEAARADEERKRRAMLDPLADSSSQE